MLHLGFVLVGVPYSVQELFTTQGGGSPYGPGHVAGGDNPARDRPAGSGDLPRTGRRLADIGTRLQKS